MSFQETLDQINKHAMFRQFEPEERVQLARYSNLLTIKRGQTIFKGNEAGDRFFIILRGDVHIELNSGKQASYAAGRLFGEISPLTGQKRFGTASAASNTSLIAFDFKELITKLEPHTHIKLYQALTRKITHYLNPTESLQLIAQGEGPRVEFKESFSKELRTKCIATMTAFMNSSGGVLFIGVNDAGAAIGLNLNGKSIDSFKLDVLNVFKQKVGKEFAVLVSLTEEEIHDQLVLRIDCKPSSKPVFMLDGQQEIYVARTASQNTFYVKPSEYVPVILERFREVPESEASK